MSLLQSIIANPNKYSLQQLQQAVESGVVPAYVGIPIIEQKLQMQQQMQLAQQAQGAPSPGQPTVAQEVMGRAQGIAGLPTQLPAEYASGGVVGFAGGGTWGGFESPDMESYAPTAPIEIPEELTGRVGLSQIYDIRSGKYGRTKDEILRAFGPAKTAFTPQQPASAAPSPAAGMKVEKEPTSPPAGAAVTSPTLKMQAPEKDKMRKEAESLFGPAGLAGRMNARRTAAESDIDQARGAVSGKAMEGFEENLRKEAESAGASKEQAKYMAMFKAGLAMMAGTSRHALENIGKGAMVGAEDYQSAVKDLKKAEQERNKQFAMIDQARRAEAIGNRDLAIRLTENARDREDRADAAMTSAIMNGANTDFQTAQQIAREEFSANSALQRTNVAGQYQLAAAGLRGAGKSAGLTAQQRGQAKLELMDRPETRKYIKSLLEARGSRFENTAEYNRLVDQYLEGQLARYYGGGFQMLGEE